MKDTKQSQPFTRRDFLSTTLKAGTAAFTTGLLPNLKAKAAERYNVLFIMVDDLRPLLGCYGHPEIHTPNIDKLAQRGTLFNRAYCQYPVCNPSRASILTGLRPNTTKVFSNKAEFRENLPNAVTLPQLFKAHGYHTQSVGKIAHNLTMQDDTYSWSVSSWTNPCTLNPPFVPSWQAYDVEDDELRDGQTAKHAVEVLKVIQKKQFFLAVGFSKPHLPLYAPEKYYKLYEGVDFSLPPTGSLPRSIPTIVERKYSDLGEILKFQDVLNEENLSDVRTLELIRAYAASTSYMDAQVGRVLNQLDTLRLTDNTVIAFAGDHGYHLGEHGTWGKNTLFEVSLRSPLIISIPRQTYQGVKTDALAELVDIYPTLCDACQLPIPLQLEGLSLLPVIGHPRHPWKTAAFSQISWGKGNSMRTERYRYTEWGNNGTLGQELYDYQIDPDETVNIASLPENSELVAQLSEQLRAGWRAALPEDYELISALQTLPWDINGDGVVDIEDLLLISNSFGAAAPENPKVDVNRDGSVNIIDLLIVAAHFGETTNPAAPSQSEALLPKHIDRIAAWLTEASRVDDGSDVFRHGMANLEALLHTVTPEKTVLLPNYPNPFNPETWIPYDLAEDAHVYIHIYNMKGDSIRQLSLGFQTAGTYRTRSQAAYWDGQNATGEPVASGLYFYSLQAGKVKLTRQMVILK